eukprot:m.75950 g.75950  ORF g.75950 m.75950 type:complete len:455 (-) comp12468_c0_seq1:238-1602(-)
MMIDCWCVICRLKRRSTMTRLALVAFALLGCVACTMAAECHGKPDPDAKMNMNAIMKDPPKFVRSVKNAKLYTVGTGDDTINVVHLWGSPYEMGFAHGQLMKDDASNFVNAVWGYLEEQVEEAINGSVSKNLQPWFLKLVSDVGLDVALDLTMDITRKYTGDYFYQEMQGLADATGLSVHMIERIHMIGELTQGDCSMYGAWGKATAGNKTMQLRALDWDVDGPFKNFPQITVYHPTNSSNGHPFANIGWTGWLGSITGMSSTQMAISEIGVAFPDDTFGDESRIGIPFTFILRDILQFDNTLQDALDRITNAHRTCDLILGVGDAKVDQGFRGIQYSASVANYFIDTDNQPVASWHPRISDIVYYGMDWLCPGYNEVLGRQLEVVHGNLDAEITIQNVTAIAQTGDLHIAIYDLTDNILHTANARRDGASGPAMAYDRGFIRLNMTEIFSETQ